MLFTSVLVAFFVLPEAAVAQRSDSTHPAVYSYLTGSKSELRTAFWWLLIPGGGHFYAKDHGNGALWALGDLSVYFVWYQGERKYGDSPWVPAIVFVGFRIAELVDAFDSVDKYNRGLARSLRLTSSGDRVTLSIPL